MLGKVAVDKVNSIVKPLKALNDVLKDSTDGVHVVYEFEDSKVFIGARNASGDCFGMYDLNVNNVVDGYEKVVDEIGIWDVNDFLNKLQLFDEDFEIKYDSHDCLISIQNGVDSANYYSSDVSIIKKGKRRLKTSSLDVGAKFVLDSQIAKLKKAISSYVAQDTINFKGDSETNEVLVTIRTDEGSSKSNSFKTVIRDVEVENDFDISFQKEQINSVLNSNGSFNVTFFVGAKNIVEFDYGNDDYNMKFYISPKEQ